MSDIYLRDKPLERKHCGAFKFITGHVFIDHPNEVKNYRAVKDELQYKSNVVFAALDFAADHSILCVLHARDYIIRDWRALPVFPLLYDRLMEKRNLHFLSTITVFDSPRVTAQLGRSRIKLARPFFPFRSTVECSLFLVNRNPKITFEKWFKDTPIHKMRQVNVWRAETVLESFTPCPDVYRSLLDMFCHPEYAVYDILPHDGGFAVAAADLERFYVGVYPASQIQKVQKRVMSIQKVSLDEIINQPIPTSSRVHKIQKAGCVFGWRSRVR